MIIEKTTPDKTKADMKETKTESTLNQKMDCDAPVSMWMILPPHTHTGLDL